VGRLDYDSEGLILLSDDGAFINEMTHPRYEHEREYEVRFSTPVTKDLLRQWTHGVALEEGLAKVDSIEQVDEKTVRLVLHQGWNRQLRRMAGVLGLAIGRLRRIRVADIGLGKLQPGSHRLLPPPKLLVP
jgi:pseudouridine synthase